MPELAQNINSLTFYIINEENVLVKLSLSHFRWLCRYGFSNVTLCLVLMFSILRAGHTKQYCILEQREPDTMLLHSWLCSSTKLVIWYKSHFIFFQFLLSSLWPFSQAGFTLSWKMNLCTFCLVLHSLNNLQVRQEALVPNFERDKLASSGGQLGGHLFVHWYQYPGLKTKYCKAFHFTEHGKHG